MREGWGKNLVEGDIGDHNGKESLVKNRRKVGKDGKGKVIGVTFGRAGNKK